MGKYRCPCCGYFTYNVPANEDCGYICPVCFWENDPFIASDNEPSDSNHGITLKEAKLNFSTFGACEKEMVCYVRLPRDDEKEKMCIRDSLKVIEGRMFMIIIRGLNKAFGEKIIFSNFNLEIPDGSFVVISGDSGSGKSTLLNMIGGIEKPDSGSIIIEGLNITRLKNKNSRCV